MLHQSNRDSSGAEEAQQIHFTTGAANRCCLFVRNGYLHVYVHSLHVYIDVCICKQSHNKDVVVVHNASMMLQAQ